MTIRHISIFLPNDSSFYRRLFGCLEKSFVQAGIKVSGCLKLLTEAEMYFWLNRNKPDAVFEMNRVKDDIPILHERDIPHITWIVDFQGRTKNHIKGSDITYFFDPGWNTNYDVGGLQDWLPPGTCTNMFTPFPLNHSVDAEFSFIGHIPKPWSDEELGRKIDLESEATFEALLHGYEKYLQDTKLEIKTHNDLADSIKKICKKLFINEDSLDTKIYYDLMEKTKRLNNRTRLLDFALRKSDSVAIYGSPNWKEWPSYQKYYKYFIDCPKEMNVIHQTSMINLHDGVSFHFRAIDCMASGGLVFFYDDYVSRGVRGLHDFFDNKRHFYAFREDGFDEAYEDFKRNSDSLNRVKNEMISIINSHHTWDHRVNKILNDIGSI
ncbi:MAG: glycosyltransferase [Methylobacter sp.]